MSRCLRNFGTNLGVKKVESPSKCPSKWLIKLLSHKKSYVPQFLKQRDINSYKRHEYNVMQHDYNVTRHDYTVKRHDYTVKWHDYNVKQHEYNVNQHDCNVTWHDYTVKRHDYNVKRHDYTVKVHDYNDKRNDYKYSKYNRSRANQVSPKLDGSKTNDHSKKLCPAVS